MILVNHTKIRDIILFLVVKEAAKLVKTDLGKNKFVSRKKILTNDVIFEFYSGRELKKGSFGTVGMTQRINKKDEKDKKNPEYFGVYIKVRVPYGKGWKETRTSKVIQGYTEDLFDTICHELSHARDIQEGKNYEVGFELVNGKLISNVSRLDYDKMPDEIIANKRAKSARKRVDKDLLIMFARELERFYENKHKDKKDKKEKVNDKSNV